ncbi:UDP-N-acetylmuramoyl-L-alanyl-D-glutamate--2,6-diaminopimelate ligase [Romboutsia maritimum]|uniref:UDP-N-acetylmuramoyl-L-alanyl-D-glutamate--2,6-diaminopimelate ligase n=1 Tax=Romboutsia maritimum TaxID=2020948 RepID=A0A371ITN1_9FIRM|nr:UDP-N-acetylmuramoyl-L-alanyl-D-glutamate--2,6-diaminopimelate ligase [Romboutsia maritimum]
MQLSKIIENLEVIEIIGEADRDITDINYDSRQVKEGSLFICIKGFNIDGHKFIQEALERGAKAFLVEEDINIQSKKNITVIKVKDTRMSMSKVASNFYENPSDKISIIGVTGTNGKTTITTLLKQILGINNKVGMIGTIKIDDGNRSIESQNTTPESIDLQKYINKMVQNKCRYCSMEVSSHSLVLGRVEDIDFKVGVFTNLTPEHLDFHKNIDEYRKAKELLFFKTKVANIINIDDLNGQIILSNIKNLRTKCYTYGINNKSDFMAKDINLHYDSVSYTLVTPTYEEKINIPLPGKFTIYNTLAVISVCYILNISIDIIKEGLENTSGVEGRLENIKNDLGISVIVDYAHTPDALKNILSTVREFSKGKIITVFGCGGDRDKTKRPIMGNISQEYSDILIITSDNPRNENPIKIIEEIMSGINKDKENYMIIEDRKQAIKRAINIAKPKDIVIIAGKGHENYQIIGDVKYYFDDREIARECIKEKKDIL